MYQTTPQSAPIIEHKNTENVQTGNAIFFQILGYRTSARSRILKLHKHKVMTPVHTQLHMKINIERAPLLLLLRNGLAQLLRNFQGLLYGVCWR